MKNIVFSSIYIRLLFRINSCSFFWLAALGLNPEIPGYCVREKDLQQCVTSAECSEDAKCLALGRAKTRYCVPRPEIGGNDGVAGKSNSAFSKDKNGLGKLHQRLLWETLTHTPYQDRCLSILKNICRNRNFRVSPRAFFIFSIPSAEVMEMGLLRCGYAA